MRYVLVLCILMLLRLVVIVLWVVCVNCLMILGIFVKVRVCVMGRLVFFCGVCVWFGVVRVLGVIICGLFEIVGWLMCLLCMSCMMMVLLVVCMVLVICCYLLICVLVMMLGCLVYDLFFVVGYVFLEMISFWFVCWWQYFFMMVVGILFVLVLVWVSGVIMMWLDRCRVLKMVGLKRFIVGDKIFVWLCIFFWCVQFLRFVSRFVK